MIMLGLCLAMLAACFDGTIVGTIGSVLAADLNGLELYAWMTTAYMLCETIMIPIAGKLSDIYGRKKLFLIGLTIFTVGSLFAGMSTSMEMFIACRAFQGLGGGILIPVATAAVADLYSPSDRARMQGILGAIFGIGSGIGPLIGGYITEFSTWHWCFYMNVPIAIAAGLLTIKKFPAPVGGERSKIDVKGLVALSVLLLDVLLLFEFGGSEFEWVSATSFAMIAIALALVVVFVLVERKAENPMLAPHLIKNPTVIMGAIFMFVFGIGMMGAMMYASMFSIYVMGLTVLEAGEWSLAMIAGMMITSISSGALVNRTGYKPWLIVGPVLCFIGLFIMSGVSVDPTMVITSSVADTYMWQYLGGMFVLGLGLGCMMSVVMSAVQNSAKPSEMGMTTSAVNLMRSVGSTMGTAIFAMVINSKLSGELLSLAPDVYANYPHDTGVLNYIATFTADQYGNVITAFGNSVNFTFLVGGTILLCLAIVGIFFKVRKPDVDEEFEAAKMAVEGRGPEE
ncbi:MAG: MDR family MFS transporter [Thermoplasmata archaeon]|nr:MDR family MFS transporter [Thermoplasmata archaeon]